MQHIKHMLIQYGVKQRFHQIFEALLESSVNARFIVFFFGVRFPLQQ